MKVNYIEIENLKCFEYQEFVLSPCFTVFIGNNGRGKTALLDAIALGLQPFVSTFDSSLSNSKQIEEEYVRRVTKTLGQDVRAEPQYPLSINLTCSLNGGETSWKRTLGGRGSHSDELKNLSNLVNSLKEQKNSPLPLLAYYRTNRIWKGDEKNTVSVKNKRLRGYADCFNAGRSFNRLIDWLSEEFQSNPSSTTLVVVKQAVEQCLAEDWHTIDYVPGEDSKGIVATATDGRYLPVHLLSDGYRNMLATVADIAYRAVTLNPDLGNKAAEETEGIVLIDEMDLHLHPKWQRTMIEQLHKAFPKIQFIGTTHSLFVVQSLPLKLGEVVSLDDPDLTAEYYNRSIEEIADNLMDVNVPQKAERFVQMESTAERYYQLLKSADKDNENELKKLAKQLDQLEMRYSDDPAYTAFLRMQRLNEIGQL